LTSNLTIPVSSANLISRTNVNRQTKTSTEMVEQMKKLLLSFSCREKHVRGPERTITGLAIEKPEMTNTLLFGFKSKRTKTMSNDNKYVDFKSQHLRQIVTNQSVLRL